MENTEDNEILFTRSLNCYEPSDKGLKLKRNVHKIQNLEERIIFIF